MVAEVKGRGGNGRESGGGKERYELGEGSIQSEGGCADELLPACDAEGDTEGGARDFEEIGEIAEQFAIGVTIYGGSGKGNDEGTVRRATNQAGA
jgi:hypothetical protein